LHLRGLSRDSAPHGGRYTGVSPEICGRYVYTSADSPLICRGISRRSGRRNGDTRRYHLHVVDLRLCMSHAQRSNRGMRAGTGGAHTPARVRARELLRNPTALSSVAHVRHAQRPWSRNGSPGKRSAPGSRRPPSPHARRVLGRRIHAAPFNSRRIRVTTSPRSIRTLAFRVTVITRCRARRIAPFTQAAPSGDGKNGTAG
jgi:hypothetical protein